MIGVQGNYLKGEMLFDERGERKRENEDVEWSRCAEGRKLGL